MGAKQELELGAKKEWELGDEHFDSVVDETILQGTSRTRTQCYSGNEKYLLQTVLCDRECLRDTDSVARASNLPDGSIDDSRCSGPWYCSRTEICELFRKESSDELAALDRRCTVVYGCANHTQCFPSAEDQQRMNIDMHTDEFTDIDLRDKGFTQRYGGVTMTTTCCVNNRKRQKGYRLFINSPCNAAMSYTLTLSATAVAATAAALLCLF